MNLSEAELKRFRVRVSAGASGGPMFNLKRKCIPGHCAAARCRQTSAVTDATGKHWEGEVELCDDHWGLRCKLENDLDLLVKTYGVPQELLGPLNSSHALAKANEEIFVEMILNPMIDGVEKAKP